MGTELRPYQTDINQATQMAWDTGLNNILMVLATGSGKTVCFSDLVHLEKDATCVIAHRQELVSQISIALARNGIYHRIIGPQKVIKMIVSMHMTEFRKSFYNPQAKTAVAGVDTLIRRGKELQNWLPTVKLWVIDEAHHLLKSNKWGKAVEMFPNARGLGVTATPLRADGKGLGAGDDNDGEFHHMVTGPSMRELINQGYLTEYRIFAPKTSDLKLDDIPISKTTGDYNVNKLREAVAHSGLVTHSKSTVVGDVVKHYLRIAPGKLGITFVPDMVTGAEIEKQFNDAGVPAILVNAKTPDDQRAAILRKFANREYMQLINVDLFGEGFDLPAIEVISMARPTASYSLYAQMFGRVLRLLIDYHLHPNWNNYNINQRLAAIASSSKPHGIVIDHVGNVIKHGLPDAPKTWSLERRSKSNDNDDATPVKSCPECTFVYERFKKQCPNPECGYIHVPADRSGPEYVDGSLEELDPSVLARMRGEITAADSDIMVQVDEYRKQLQTNHVKQFHVMAHCKRYAAKLEHQQSSQKVLRDKMAWWAGHRRSEGHTDDELFKIFYLRFGIDWLSAQALPGDEADALNETIGDPSGKK